MEDKGYALENVNQHEEKNDRIIVIGASAGGFSAIQKLVSALPANFQSTIFIVWHMSPDIRGVLPMVLNRLDTIAAS